jgi:hypothetical protein
MFQFLNQPKLFLGAFLAATALTAQAAVIDLTTNGSSTTINGAIYQAFDSSGSIGTGNSPDFVRIQTNRSVSQGYNSNAPADLDATNTFHNTFLLSTMRKVTIGGVEYVQFKLDINEGGNTSNQLLSLDAVQIFTSTSSILSGYSNCSLGGVSCIYDMDAGSNNAVLLTAALNSGSGNGYDMILNLPVSVFGSVNPFTHYVYLYSRFGEQTGYAQDGGFEAWIYNRCDTNGPACWDRPSEVPLPGSLALLGLGMLGLGLKRRQPNA